MTCKYSGRLLIVDDDWDFIRFIKTGLEEEGYICDVTTGLESINDNLKQFSYDGVLLDLFFGEVTSLSLIPEIVRSQPYARVLVLTANASVQAAVEAICSGAADFIEKNSLQGNIIDRIKAKLNRPNKKASDQQSLRIQSGIVGSSDMTKDIWDRIVKLKDVDSTVLILGESGCGKELIARALHQLSNRKEGPFEAINCPAVPENLIESELFGHKKGSFTDAKSDKRGLFEVCTNGTLFLDEIAEMPLNSQVKLLRVLQEREIRPLGAVKSIEVNTRIIAATNKDLYAEVTRKAFREDLYYRLSVFVINIPPLRSRKDDINDLVLYYLDKFNKQYKKNIKAPSPEIMTKLYSYDWPGNIRELKHSIERAVVMAEREELEIKDLISSYKSRSVGGGGFEISSPVYSEAKELFEKNYLQKILELAGGNVSEAARISGRFRSDIYRMMKRYNLRS